MQSLLPTKPQHYVWPLAALCVITLFLFLGDTLFNTRGEPREAVVALSMLKEGNWVLPINNGVDMAYKPPFFHWLVALCSLPIGHVTEYTARMPSAIAATVMVLAGFKFFQQRQGTAVAMLMAVVTLGSFEVHRAAVACRVDMVLTCMMVLSLYTLYIWVERGMKGIPLWGVLCLSAAFLSKGPVGMGLPCVVVAVFAWLRGHGFWRVTWRMALVGVLALVLPAAWYVAAWREGGDRFLHLVYEENVLRLLGRMTYESHVNPWHYNVLTLVTGFVPYTLLMLLSLPVLPWRKLKPWLGRPAQWWTRLKAWVRGMDDARLFALLSAVIIFVFYCIPKSKRSVYLLPVYPFVAYYMAEYLLWLRHNHRRVLDAFGWVLTAVALVLTLVFWAIRLGLVPTELVAGGHGGPQNVAMLTALQHTPYTPMLLVTVMMPLIGVAIFMRHCCMLPLTSVVILVFALYFGLDGAYQPIVLNTKSDKPQADYIARMAPTGTIYSYRTDVTPGNPMHPFTLNFYLGDRIAPIEASKPMPCSGLLVVGNDEIETFKQQYAGRYKVQLVQDFDHRSCDDHKMLKLYRFETAPCHL